MGITITVRLDQSRLEEIIAAAPSVEATVVQRGADMVKRLAKGIVPVDTGALQQSIDTYPIAENVVMVAALAPYALFVEMGTTKMSARPYLIPSLEAVPWVSLLREAFREIGL